MRRKLMSEHKVMMYQAEDYPSLLMMCKSCHYLRAEFDVFSPYPGAAVSVVTPRGTRWHYLRPWRCGEELPRHFAASLVTLSLRRP